MKDLIKMGRQLGKSIMTQDFIGNTDRFDLEVLDAQFLGQTYYGVRLRDPFGQEFEWAPMVEWCEHILGPLPALSTLDQRWYTPRGQFWFRNATDRTMFLLRWSS
jgi:hypothetical protein